MLAFARLCIGGVVALELELEFEFYPSGACLDEVLDAEPYLKFV
jgi:hypothetical protein